MLQIKDIPKIEKKIYQYTPLNWMKKSLTHLFFTNLQFRKRKMCSQRRNWRFICFYKNHFCPIQKSCTFLGTKVEKTFVEIVELLFQQNMC